MPFHSSCCGCSSCSCSSCCDDDDKHKKHKHDKHEDSSDLKFSGIVQALAADQTTFLGDAGPVILGNNVPFSYPAARRGRLKNLAVNISQAVLVPPTGLVAIQLFKNGLAVPNFLVTWGPGETTGLKSTRTDSLKLSRDDLFNLQLRMLNMQLSIDAITLGATIGVVDDE